MLARASRIQHPLLRLFLVTFIWPTVAVGWWIACARARRWPRPGVLSTMYRVAIGDALLPYAREM